MIDIRDMGHIVALIIAWIMANVSIILAVTIMLLQIYILILKIKKLRRDNHIDNN